MKKKNFTPAFRRPSTFQWTLILAFETNSLTGHCPAKVGFFPRFSSFCVLRKLLKYETFLKSTMLHLQPCMTNLNIPISQINLLLSVYCTTLLVVVGNSFKIMPLVSIVTSVSWFWCWWLSESCAWAWWGSDISVKGKRKISNWLFINWSVREWFHEIFLINLSTVAELYNL